MDTALEHLDVVIVGAGLSGIGAAYRVSTGLPGKSFAVLEARSAIGGTWDLFRYPGVRSDSDMFTLGYPFRPWTEAKAIADGSSILSYIRDTADDPRIRERIRFRTKLISAAWSSEDARWTLELEVTDDVGATERRRLTCGFLYLCSGYYDYDRGYEPSFPGIESFTGEIVRPQFWPEELDYAGKRVVVIGSGATAVTLVPSMAKEAGHVTMLQRSPTYVTAVPSRDKFSDAVRRRLPAGAAHHVARAKNVLFTQAFYQLCRRRPELAKKLIRTQTERILGDEASVRENFTPAYNPWDQRLCVAPSADLFKALKSGAASVVTDTIDTFTPTGIRLASGQELEADVVVTATGLSMLPLGGATFTVDGREVNLGDSWVYRGLMVSGVPNLALCVGYTNASWTLRADLSSRYVCRLIRYLDRHGHRYAAPAVDGDMTARPILDLTSGYVQRAVSAFPKQGDRQPWIMRQNYLLDAPTALRGSLSKNMVFDTPVPSSDTPAPDLQEIHA
ncbi:NAD(P)/FAD-dependent oxidoreductase [Arthrobacter agilis]|uniref:flavin-containing monooxygenase n=1 Tax=Arthrobacter agilis TaxID=37921 RepID=UPI000B34BBBC|nr:NAD(P)/FAD-dependent oxidoreductase [Arthrobacter agilis]OUM40669.1 FAD-containing monooxygenase EthA [Arthrobacter agilis]PPB45279.1 NAD(P)/FAD-dependent oxidoreductase [Arthrobacter agilis]TPV27986.1 NAD(P)/FAD-dependent oxidoreductase [Arthrobacter agilis]VDR31325.1 FAD-containing monooxygenase EthA [Arthrobacter agilis]